LFRRRRFVLVRIAFTSLKKVKEVLHLALKVVGPE
jgi:hypothetical protein